MREGKAALKYSMAGEKAFATVRAGEQTSMSSGSVVDISTRFLVWLRRVTAKKSDWPT